MHNAEKLDLTHWSRQQHFHFFNSFSQPYFNVTLTLNAAVLFDYVKCNQLSFSRCYLYLLLKATNNYQPMALRIVNGEVWHFKNINASVVQLCEDESFRFSYLDFFPEYPQFDEFAIHAVAKAKTECLFSQDFNNNEGQRNTLYISVLPWINFTSFQHATHLPSETGIPKLVFGQYEKSTGTMPLSIEVHHGLMDGVHVAKFVQLLQDYFNNPHLHLA